LFSFRVSQRLSIFVNHDLIASLVADVEPHSPHPCCTLPPSRRTSWALLFSSRASLSSAGVDRLPPMENGEIDYGPRLEGDLMHFAEIPNPPQNG
jgi:hypothetical protein